MKMMNKVENYNVEVKNMKEQAADKKRQERRLSAFWKKINQLCGK